MTALDVAALVLFVAPVIDWTAWVILHAVARHKPPNAAAIERARSQFALSIAATIGAILGWAALTRVSVGRDVLLAALTAALALITVPAAIWLLMLIRGDFWLDDE